MNGGGDAQLILDGDVIGDIVQEESNYASFSDQILNHVEKVITEMGLDSMASTGDFVPQDLTTLVIFHGVI